MGEWNYERIKEEAALRGCKIDNLIAMQPRTDPFYVGTDEQLSKVEWFVELYNRLEIQPGAHIRGIHYKLVSQDESGRRRWDGKLYTNEKLDFAELGKAAKWARYLCRIPEIDLEDQRNPDPIRSAPSFLETDSDATWSLDTWQFAEVSPLRPLEPLVTGYSSTTYRQEYLIELWTEKTTMLPVLEPLAERYGLNIIPFAGHASLTACTDFIQRLDSWGGPARIFYISDYDKQGYEMPPGVARKIEFYLQDRSDNVKLQPLVLTREQITYYGDIPAVIGEKRVGKWAENVELDALDAVHPGELHRIVEDAVLQYRDRTLSSRLAEANAEADVIMSTALEEAAETHQERIDGLLARYQVLTEELGEIADDLRFRLCGRAIRLWDDVVAQAIARQLQPVNGIDHRG